MPKRANYSNKRNRKPLPLAKGLPNVSRMFDPDKPSARGRSCGSCSACCTVLRVRLDGPEGTNSVIKPGNTPCSHLRKLRPGRSGSCGIYGEHPYDCVIYRCYWLEGFGEGRDRPDRLGMILDSADGIIGGIYALSGIRCLTVHEVRPGANKSKRFMAAIAMILERDVGIIYHGGGLDPVMSNRSIRSKLVAAMSVLDGASTEAREHGTGKHASNPHPICPVCVGVCPAHGLEPSPICGVCLEVAAGNPPVDTQLSVVTPNI